jgi:hypothetical protein
VVVAAARPACARSRFSNSNPERVHRAIFRSSACTSPACMPCMHRPTSGTHVLFCVLCVDLNDDDDCDCAILLMLIVVPHCSRCRINRIADQPSGRKLSHTANQKLASHQLTKPHL